MRIISRLLPWLVVAVAMALAINFLGRGSFLLFSWSAPETDPEDAADAEEASTESIGHHAVEEWPEDRSRDFQEAPALAAMVEAGELPPVDERLPQNPLVVVPPEQMGPYGGRWRQLATGPGDIGAMTSLTYETLIRWDPLLQNYLPNLATEWSVEDEGRTYTFEIREGIRWSDGEPFGVDDILFWYEHVVTNEEITPVRPQSYVRGGEMMEVTALDEKTIQFQFAEPHGLFLMWVANPLMTELINYPAHYFKQFHPAFTDERELNRQARARGFNLWHELFLDRVEWRNVDRPTITAWKVTRPPPSRPIFFERNPYYWKVDPEGRQLPYLDRLTYEISGREPMNLKFVNGAADFQHRHVDVKNYALFMDHREKAQQPYRIVEWVSTFGSGVLMPNLNHRDPAVAELINERDFRIALSHAINREEINEAMYFGLGRPAQMAPVETSPIYDERHVTAFTEYDPQRTEELLDGLGLEKGPDGFRNLPDGSPLHLTIEMFDLIADVETMNLVATYWTEAGIRTDVRPLARSLFYERMPAGLHDVAVGGNSSMHTPLLDHMYFVPAGTGARHALDYSRWYTSGGTRGETPPPAMRETMRLYDRIQENADPEVQNQLGREIMDLHAEHLWLIGLVGDLPGLVLVNKAFRNIPDEAVIFGQAGITAPEIYSYDPE